MEELNKIQPLISLILTAGTFIGMAVAIYKMFRDPDEKASQEIALLKQGCKLKHTRLDEIMENIGGDVRMIKENDLKHVELSISAIEKNQSKIFTILEERLPKR